MRPTGGSRKYGVGIREKTLTSYSLLPTSVVSGQEWLIFLAVSWQGSNLGYCKVSRMKYVALGLIRFYQKFISPNLPSACRFHPTCSHYGYEAIAKYGIIKGCWMTAKRLGRCHPFHPGGYDPVP